MAASIRIEAVMVRPAKAGKTSVAAYSKLALIPWISHRRFCEKFLCFCATPLRTTLWS